MITTANKIDQLLVRIIRMCFLLLLLFVPLYFAFDTKELFEFNKMLAVYLLTVIITSAWLARMIVQRKFIWQPTAFDTPLLIFLISQLLSTIFSIHPRTSLLGYYSRFHGGLLSTIAYLLLYWSFVTHVRKKDLPAYFFTALIGGLLVSLYAIPEHFGHSLSCLRVSAAFDVDCWKQDVRSRVFATFGQPNWLAAYTITLLPLSAMLAHFGKNITRRLLAAVVTISLFVTLLFTQSRSGLLGLTVGVINAGVLMLMYVLQQKKQLIKKQKLWKSILLIGLPTLGALVIFGSVYSPPLKNIFRHKTPTVKKSQIAPIANRLEIGGSSSAEIRKIVWKGALKVWRRYPLLGSGVETFGYSYYLDRPVEHNQVSEWNFLYNKAHNEFLNFLATTGIVGLVSYLAILIVAGIISLRLTMTATNTSREVVTIIALWSGIAALSTSNFFGFSTVMVSVLLFLYLAILALINQRKNLITTNQTSQDPIKKLTLLSGVQLVVVAGVALLLIFSILRTRRADVIYARGTQEAEQNLWEQAFADLTTAHNLSPQEAQYTDTLAITYAKVATALGLSGDATNSAQLATTAINLSDQTLNLNPQQRNFYKTRAQIFLLLAQIKPDYLSQAQEALETELRLAPTDAKTMYNLGIITAKQKNTDAAIKWLKKAVVTKPNYDVARLELSKQLLLQQQFAAAKKELEYILARQPDNKQAREVLQLVKAQKNYDQ